MLDRDTAPRKRPSTRLSGKTGKFLPAFHLNHLKICQRSRYPKTFMGGNQNYRHWRVVKWPSSFILPTAPPTWDWIQEFQGRVSRKWGHLKFMSKMRSLDHLTFIDLKFISKMRSLDHLTFIAEFLGREYPNLCHCHIFFSKRSNVFHTQIQWNEPYLRHLAPRLPLIVQGAMKAMM